MLNYLHILAHNTACVHNVIITIIIYCILLFLCIYYHYCYHDYHDHYYHNDYHTVINPVSWSKTNQQQIIRGVKQLPSSFNVANFLSIRVVQTFSNHNRYIPNSTQMPGHQLLFLQLYLRHLLNPPVSSFNSWHFFPSLPPLSSSLRYHQGYSFINYFRLTSFLVCN